MHLEHDWVYVRVCVQHPGGGVVSGNGEGEGGRQRRSELHSCSSLVCQSNLQDQNRQAKGPQHLSKK